MKKWTLPEIQELNVSATAHGGDKNHYEGDPSKLGHDYSMGGVAFVPEEGDKDKNLS